MKRLLLFIFSFLGRYVQFTRSQNELIQTEFLDFKGDIPVCAGDIEGQYRLEYKLQRDLQETVANIIYTSAGVAWHDGRVFQRYCLREPSIKEILLKPKIYSIKLIEQGTLVQVQTPVTYGDWVSEHLMCLVRVKYLLPPLLLPEHLMARSYVRRDLERLGIKAEAVSETVMVKKALVVHKTRHSHYLTQEEVDAYRFRMDINPPAPEPGSVLYLSRKNVIGDAFQRSYPSELIEEILVTIGVTVVDTCVATLGDYQALANKAETVICDFGSAYLNLLEWNTKNLIVLYTDEWWDSCSLFLGRALGLKNIIYRRITNDMSHGELEDVLVIELRKLELCN